MAKEIYTSSGNKDAATFRRSEHLSNDAQRRLKHGRLRPMRGYERSSLATTFIILASCILAAIAITLMAAGFLAVLNWISHG